MRYILQVIFGALICLVGLVACEVDDRPTPIFHTDAPDLLSEWGVIGIKDGNLRLGKGVVPYTLNTPLFTDYAHKLRTVWIPDGTASYREGETLDFPVGTVISKTFYYPTSIGHENDRVYKRVDTQPVNQVRGLDLSKNRLLETRLLVRRKIGWEPVSYIWNKAETQARLTRIGGILKLSLDEAGQTTPFAYVVPNINQCAGCHAPNNTTRDISPIGPKPRHLNGMYNYANGAMNVLDKWVDLGVLEAAPTIRPKAADWEMEVMTKAGQDLDALARSYLDINCAHCHNPVGPADTSGLHLNPENLSAPHLGICKIAVAAGGGTGGREFDIDPGVPENSILLYRMQSRDPGAMMPELGRSLTHAEGVDLIRDWIAAMPKGCG